VTDDPHRAGWNPLCLVHRVTGNEEAEEMNLTDGTVVSAGGTIWFICTYRRGILRAVPMNYDDGRVILILEEFTEAYPDAAVIWKGAQSL
jgi:hypothetical protein